MYFSFVSCLLRYTKKQIIRKQQGETVKLNCKFEMFPPFYKYTWMKTKPVYFQISSGNDLLLPQKYTLKFKNGKPWLSPTIFNYSKVPISSTLIISNFTQTYAGTYLCKVTNALFTSKQEITLEMLPNLRTEKTSSSSKALPWKTKWSVTDNEPRTIAKGDSIKFTHSTNAAVNKRTLDIVPTLAIEIAGSYFKAMSSTAKWSVTDELGTRAKGNPIKSSTAVEDEFMKTTGPVPSNLPKNTADEDRLFSILSLGEKVNISTPAITNFSSHIMFTVPLHVYLLFMLMIV